MTSQFVSSAGALGFELDETARRRFETYRNRLAAASLDFNLTTVRDPDAIEVRHLLESLALGRLLAEQGLLDDDARVLDIGSGAGLPGLPLQIAFPDIEVTMLESLTKRCVFLQAMVDELGLDHTHVLNGRAEEFGRDPRYRAAFDLVVARAVAAMPVLLEYSLPFLAIGGRLAATKGSATLRELDESARALAELGGEHVVTLPLDPPGGVAQSVVIVRKVAETPERYPRRPGLPAKRPIV